jgi:hypothetical protein
MLRLRAGTGVKIDSIFLRWPNKTCSVSLPVCLVSIRLFQLARRRRG